MAAPDTEMVCKIKAEPGALFGENRLFEGVPASILDVIVAQIRVVHLRAGEVIFREGEKGDSLFLVAEGSVRISKVGRGAEQETLGFIHPRNFFGEMALLDGQPRSAQAAAAQDTMLGCVDEHTFRHILEVAPSSVHIAFLKSVVQRLRDVNSHFIGEVMRAERLSLVGSMASSIIHDLKSPIGVIRCCADMLATQHPDPRSEELTTIINKSTDRMILMSEELLEFTRGDLHVELAEVSVETLLEELDDSAFHVLPKYHVALTQDIQYRGKLSIDVPRFVRLIDNLVKNARQAMPGGGRLGWHISREGQNALFKLQDTGCGIPKHFLPRIFEPFNSHGKKNSTGLGMAIAKSVVEAHGGSIAVASVVGVGTTVEIRLPLAGRL